MNKIHAERDFHSLRIYVNELLHLELPMKNHNGLQSWLEGSKKHMYFIQLYRKQGESIILEYDDRSIWEEVLKLIEANI